MSEVQPPLWIQNGTYPALVSRTLAGAMLMQDPASVFETLGGVLFGHANSLKVTTGGASVNIAAGQLAVSDGTGGAYICTNDATVNISIPATTGTARWDIIGAVVDDTEQGGSTDTWSIVRVAGTTTSDPALPSFFQPLARIRMPSTASSVSSGNIDDLRTYTTTAGGVLVCTSSSRPSVVNAPLGRIIFETDTGKMLYYDGSGWQQFLTNASIGDSGWITGGFSPFAVVYAGEFGNVPQPYWSLTNARIRGIVIGTVTLVVLEVSATRMAVPSPHAADATITATGTGGGAPGNITNAQVCTVGFFNPATNNVRATFVSNSAGTSGGARMRTDGILELVDMHPSSVITAGDDINITASWMI